MQILTYIYYDFAISWQLSIEQLLHDKTLLSLKNRCLSSQREGFQKLQLISRKYEESLWLSVK